MLRKFSSPRTGGAVVAIALAGIFAFWLGVSAVPNSWAVELVRYTTKPIFYLIHAVILLFFLRWVDWRRALTAPRRHYLLLGLVLTGTLFLVSREPYGFKVLSDEYVISSQAKSLHFNNTSDFPEGAFAVYGSLTPRHARIDKRPPAYSVLLATFHDLFGYRVNHVFILNTLLAGGILWLLLYMGRSAARSEGRPNLFLTWVLALTLSIPLFAQNANGAGLELYNLLLILSSGLLAYRFLQDNGQNWLPVFLGVSLLLFYTRYESALFAVSVGGVILLKAWRTGKMSGFWWVLALPFLLIPYLLRHRVFELMPEVSWQLSPDQTSAFSMAYLSENIGYAVMYFYQWSLQGSGSYLLAYLGTIAGLVIAVRVVKKLLLRKPFGLADQVLLLYGAVVVFNFLLLMFYHWGQLESIEVARLALPAFLLLGFATVRVGLPLFRKEPRYLYAALALSVAYVFFFTIPSAATATATNRNYHARIDAWAVGLLGAEKEPNPLVISPVPLIWDLHETAFYHPDALSRKRKSFEFHWLSQSFTPYILEKIKVDPVTGGEEVVEASDFAAPYQLEVLGEYPYKPYHYARFSRIVGFRDPEARKEVFDKQAIDNHSAFPIEYWFLQIP